MGLGGFLKKHGGRIALGAATGGFSEIGRAAMGESSIYDPVLDAAGVGIDRAGAAPTPEGYFDETEAAARERMRRAYEMGERARAFDVPDIREPGVIRPELLQGITTDMPLLGPAQGLAAPTIAPTERVTAPTLGEAAMQAQTGVGMTGEDPVARGFLEAAARGDEPSEAEALLRLGLDKISKKQRAMAAEARGGERRGARRAAMLAIGEEGAELGQRMAATRAAEMATARGQLATMAQQSQALRQQAMNLQAQIDAARRAGDAEAANRFEMQQAALLARADEFNAQAENIRGLQQAGLTMRAGEFTAGAQNLRDVQKAELLQRWREGEAARAMETGQFNIANILAGDIETGRMRQARDIAAGGQEITAQSVRQAGEQAALGQVGAATGMLGDVAGTKFGSAYKQWQDAKAREEAGKAGRIQLAGRAGLFALTGGASEGAAGLEIMSALQKMGKGGKKPAYDPDAPLGMSGGTSAYQPGPGGTMPMRGSM